ncbi:hypothetical protein [Desmospora activa]|uniref:hypothetical protein n=1 Tax=Desmospora activa TaxID=500615 RepID=UPI0011B26C40|nr:hypothetical protein [Desmospora activa]
MPQTNEQGSKDADQAKDGKKDNALVLKPNEQAVEYKGEPVIQACDVITLDDLKKAGQTLYLSDGLIPNGIQRTHFNGEGKGEVDTSADYAILRSIYQNECDYGIQRPERSGGVVNIKVYQPAYTNQKALNREMEKFNAIPDIEGVKAYHYQLDEQDEFKDYLLQQGTITAHIYTDIEDEKAVKSLLQSAAKRLKQLEAKPIGPSQVEYKKSPNFSASYVNSCEYIGNDDFKNLFGVDAGPLVSEGISSTVGFVREDPPGQNSYHYMTHSCSYALHEARGNKQVLSIKTIAYEDEQKAAAAFEMWKEPKAEADNVRDIPSIGTGAYYTVGEDGLWDLVFLVGRVEVHMSFVDDVQKPSTHEERFERLTPIAQAVVERMKD